MKYRAHTLILSGALLSWLITASAVEDRYSSYGCPQANHLLGCGHKIAVNPGLCWNNNGNGVQMCENQSLQSECEDSAAHFYEVYGDWPQGIQSNATTICSYQDVQHTVYAAHTEIGSDVLNCYHTVKCAWNENYNPHCFVKSGSGGAWFTKSKKKTVPCG